MALLEVRNVCKVYKTRLAGSGVEALRNVSCAVGQGEFVAIMGTNVPLVFEVPSIAVVYTVFVYAVVLAINLLVNLGRVSLAKPIELLRGTDAGDREPRTRWFVAVIGCLTLLGGYLISFLANPLENLGLFLGAGSAALQAGDPQLQSVMCAYFFAGLFLSVLFLMGSALVLYYKQVSEGFEDARGFTIMQQVGMSAEEVWGTIRGQAPLAFIPPLALAACHTAAALPMTSKILAALGITDFWFVFLCYIATLLAYAAVYFLVYFLTSRERYRIVLNRSYAQ